MYSNIYAPQDHITKVNPSIGGYCNLYLLPIQFVQTWPSVDPLTGLISIIPTPITGKEYFGIENMPADAQYNEEEEDSNAGPFFRMVLTMPVADESNASFLSAIAHRWHQFVIIMEEQNGMVRMIGNADAGAKIKQGYRTGDDEGTRQRILTATWESESPAIIGPPEILDNIDYITTEDGFIITTEDGEGLTT